MCSRTYACRVAAVGVLMLVLGRSSTGQAQAAPGSTYSIGANAGLVVPTGDLGNATSSGYTIAATLGMHQALVPFALRVEGSFTELPYNDNVAQGAKHQIYGFAVDGQYNLGTPSANGGLYITAGIGYFGSRDTNIPSFTFGTIETTTTWNVGVNAGLGYYLPLSGFTMYFEGRYRNIFANTHEAMFPITVGIAF